VLGLDQFHPVFAAHGVHEKNAVAPQRCALKVPASRPQDTGGV
jgi:hypothetical protein